MSVAASRVTVVLQIAAKHLRNYNYNDEGPSPRLSRCSEKMAQTLVTTQKTCQRAATDAPWTSTMWLTTTHNSPGPHRQSCCQAEHIKAICFGSFHFHCGRTSSGLIRNGAKTSSSSSLVLLLSDCQDVQRNPSQRWNTFLLGSRCVGPMKQDRLFPYGTVWKHTDDHPSLFMHLWPAANSL